MSNEREAFEQTLNPCSRERNEVGDYVSAAARDAWAGWQARAAWQRSQQSTPAGYVMVPVEPTHEMLEALWGRSFDQFDEGGAKKIARIKYQGLLAAAPKAEPIKEGYRLVAVNEAFSSLMYCLGQASDTGYLDRLGDLVEPWEAFDYEYVDSLGDKK